MVAVMTLDGHRPVLLSCAAYPYSRTSTNTRAFCTIKCMNSVSSPGFVALGLLSCVNTNEPVKVDGSHRFSLSASVVHCSTEDSQPGAPIGTVNLVFCPRHDHCYGEHANFAPLSGQKHLPWRAGTRLPSPDKPIRRKPSSRSFEQKNIHLQQLRKVLSCKYYYKECPNIVKAPLAQW